MKREGRVDEVWHETTTLGVVHGVGCPLPPPAEPVPWGVRRPEWTREELDELLGEFGCAPVWRRQR